MTRHECTLTFLNQLQYAMALQMDREGREKEAKELYKQLETKTNLEKINNKITEMPYSWNRAPISKLPKEVLSLIFQELSIKDLSSCSTTCTEWKRNIQNDQSLWNQKIQLKGTLKQMEDQWSHISEMMGFSKVIKLEMILDKAITTDGWTGRDRSDWETSIFQWTFPFDTLEEFWYGSWSAEIDQQVWKLINRCKNLKVLRWTSCGFNRRRETARTFTCGERWKKYCRLEELKFLVAYPHTMGDGIHLLISQAHTVYMNGELDSSTIATILRSAQESLVVFTISPVYSRNNQWTQLDMSSEPVEMRRLQTLCIGDRHINGITAPLLLNLEMKSSGPDKSSILDSCKAELENLCLYVDPQDALGVSELLFELPRCSALFLQMWPPSHTPFPFWSHFSKDIEEEEAIELHRAIPNIQSIAIQNDQALTGVEVINFLQHRAQAGLPKITLSFSDCHSLHPNAVSWIKKNNQWSDSSILHIRRLRDSFL